MTKKFLTPINIANLSSDPVSASDGDFYYNTASDTLKIHANGLWQNISTGGGGVTSLVGTEDEINVSASTGNITISVDAAIARLNSPTFTGVVVLPTSSSANPSIRIPHGTAPSSPTNGDMWTTTDGVYARVNGSTIGPFGTKTGSFIVSDTAPLSPITGDQWFSSADLNLYVYYDSFWVQANGGVKEITVIDGGDPLTASGQNVFDGGSF